MKNILYTVVLLLFQYMLLFCFLINLIRDLLFWG